KPITHTTEAGRATSIFTSGASLLCNSDCYSLSSIELRPVHPRHPMNISEPFIRRPVGTSLLALGLFLSGLVAYRFMPVAAIPRVAYPMITVSASLPGADPATVASSLATPLERRLGQIAGVTEMTSVSTLGGCNVSIQFDLNRNVDDAAHDVQAA